MRSRLRDLMERGAATVLVLAELSAAGCSSRPSTLRITSPADGERVASGRTLVVKLEASRALRGAALLGSPVPGVWTLKTPPWEFKIPIPPDMPSRTYSLLAAGTTTGGEGVGSGPVTIDVERPDPPVQITNDVPDLYLPYIGAKLQLLVDGIYSDGSRVDLIYSSLTTYSSDSPAVASVSGTSGYVPGTGFVTAVGPGTANITITNAGVSTTVPVTVPQPVRVLPTAVTVNPSKTKQFYAQIAMSPGTDPTVTWSIHPGLGSIDGTGLYTAPSSVDSATRVVVTATSVADPTESGSADVQLLPPVSISITPTAATLSAGSPAYFIATVVNAVNPTVNWSVSPAGAGTVDQWGDYTAPATIASPQTVTVTATSAADKTKTASAQVALVPSIALSAGPASVTPLEPQLFGWALRVESVRRDGVPSRDDVLLQGAGA